jgi:NAD(P)H-dependent flavin oxidoreductase YrpB (nitropropane dioxygenase family)
VLLRADESGTNQPYRTALADPARRDAAQSDAAHSDTGHSDTVVTRAFTGRPARALRNRFTERYSDLAPGGYPALHHLTSPLRKASIAAGDPERVNLWAGTGYRHATAEPAADILARLAGQT